MNISTHHFDDIDRLKKLVNTESNAKQRDRYRSVVLALTGLTEPEIRLRTGRSRGFIQRWVYAYRDGGIDSLLPKRPTGKPPKLTSEQQEELKQILNQPNAPRRGRDIQRLLEKQFDVKYSIRGAVVMLHRLGYEPLKPRPVNPKKDIEAEAKWQKDAPFLSR